MHVGRQAWRAAALTAAATALTVSCGWAAALYGSEVSADQLEGRWTDGSGTSLTFNSDRTFTSEHFDRLPVVADAGCSDPSVLSSGRWAFYASSTTQADETATRGSILSLDSSDDSCSVSAFFFGDDDPAMCPTDDPDANCPTGYFHRTGHGT
ncbi:hypothetical protein [Streptomyces sp. NBC_00887]|uniref:hypothetical protein n=1 Tax=Streptomyces sp. NBC_00887 TaxID=2975859 RepID=UPI003863593A|nr:hypothetical protein OG844_19705 [Streptomyces sp. NBC_00887]